MQSPELSAHDRELAGLIAAIATDAFVGFLEEHDFGGSWRKEWADPIYHLSDFLASPRAEFTDEELQGQLAEVHKAARKLGHQLAMWGGPISGIEIFNMIPTRETELGEWSTQTEERVQQVNDQADLLASQLRSLFRSLRKKGANLLASGDTLET